MAETAAGATLDKRTGLARELGLRDLALFLIPCITGPRWIAAAANAGSGTITLWALTVVLFAAPLGIAVAALMAKYPVAGGLYVWAREDFGPWHGFLSFFTYWISIAFTLPSAAIFAMSVGVFALGPSYAHLADERWFLLVASLSGIWIALGTNIVGLKVGKWTENLGGMATFALGLLLVVVAWAVYSKRGVASPLNPLPSWNWKTLQVFAVISFAMSGPEAAGLMAGEVRQPEKTVAPAIWTATTFASMFYVACTAALLVVLKQASISELHGVADVGASAGQLLHFSWLPLAIAALVLMNAVGALGGWGSAVSRLPYAAGVDHLLPAAFGRVHPRWHTPYISILALGIVASLVLLLVQIGDALKPAIQAMISIMVITGYIPYIYIFASAWKAGKRVAAVLGEIATLFTFACSFVPDPDARVWLFELKIAIGILAVLGAAVFLYSRGNPAYLKKSA